MLKVIFNLWRLTLLHIKTFKSVRRTVIALLIIAIILSLVTFAVSARSVVDVDEKGMRNILLLCLDETGYNTDAMALIGIPKNGGVVTVMQIPRDTYANTGEENCKINRLYYRFYEKYGQESSALAAFSEK